MGILQGHMRYNAKLNHGCTWILRTHTVCLLPCFPAAHKVALPTMKLNADTEYGVFHLQLYAYNCDNCVKSGVSVVFIMVIGPS